jgi:hypothetical protein
MCGMESEVKSNIQEVLDSDLYQHKGCPEWVFS